MRSLENIAEELFDKIRSRVANIKLGNSEGEITTDPRQAKFFEFNFKHRDLPIGAVAISLNEEGILQVYFPNSMVEDADSSTADAWYGFLKELRKFSARNMLNFEVKNLTKERLDKKDYQFLTQRNQDEVMETKMYGSKRKSYLEAGQAKIIVQHDRTVDEEKMGARSRNIKAIYIENSDGERFKFVNNYLPGARAMARHVSNEGITKDEIGAHIVEIMDEMNQLKSFVKAVKSQDYVNEDAQEVISAATDRYYGLKDTLKSISSAKGYADYFENWAPGQVEVEEDDIEDLKTKLTRQVFDDRITDTLPSVGRALIHKQEQANMEAKKNDEEELDAPIKDYFDTSVDPQEPKELEKQEKNIASSEQALADLASNDENIVVFDNPNKDEIKSYLAMMKQSDMPTEPKNQNMIVNIIEYLANNMVDDNAARALSNLDLGSPEGRKTGMQVAVKYLKGKVELQAPKVKKDKFGKAKEDTTFEAYAQRMDMIAEGTWSLPENEAEARQLAELMDDTITLGDGGNDAINALGGLLGDDGLFDDLGVAGDKDPEGDARPIIIRWMMEHTDWENETYSQMMQVALDKIHRDGNDDIAFEDVEVEEGHKHCPECGCEIGSPEPGCDCAHDVHMHEAELDEGKMKDLMMHIEEMIADGATNEEIKDMHPMVSNSDIEMIRKQMDESVQEGVSRTALYDTVAKLLAKGHSTAAIKKKFPDIHAKNPEYFDKVIQALKDRDEIPYGKYKRVKTADDEVAESIAKMKAMAGVGSGARSNHGIHEGEEGYRLTPRSLVAREMRKLQDLEK